MDLISAVQGNDVGRVQLMLTMVGSVDPNAMEGTALRLAASRGHVDCVKVSITLYNPIPQPQTSFCVFFSRFREFQNEPEISEKISLRFADRPTPPLPRFPLIFPCFWCRKTPPKKNPIQKKNSFHKSRSSGAFGGQGGG